MSEKDDQRLYKDLAWTWPIISPPSHYVEETEFFATLIKKYSKTKVENLLHIGCGGGHNDYAFKKYFNTTGVDINDSMLELARKLNPEVTYLNGDMRTVRCNTLFDAVVILDSIGYMTTTKDLEKAFQTAYTHLKRGGVFLTLVEALPEKFIQNRTECRICSEDNTEIVFMENYYDPDPSDTTYECTFVYLIRRHGNLKIYTDRHICGVFSLETWLNLLNGTGFEVIREHSNSEEGDYPLLICIKV